MDSSLNAVLVSLAVRKLPIWIQGLLNVHFQGAPAQVSCQQTKVMFTFSVTRQNALCESCLEL